MPQPMPDNEFSRPRQCERDYVAILIFAVASAVFVLAVLSLKLGVTPFSLRVKLLLFGAACVSSVTSMGVALLAMRQPSFDHAWLRLGTLYLVVAMLLTAASAVGKLPAKESPHGTGLSNTTVSIAPHVDLRGTKLVLGGSGAARPSHAASLVGEAFGKVFVSAFKQALSTLAGGSGALLGTLAKAGITISPNFYFGEGSKGESAPSLDTLVAALEKAHVNLELNGGLGTPPPRTTPTDCARYYLELDEIADDEPQIASRWPASSVDEEARACGLGKSQAMASFLGYLAKR
jgi:hypothetical protein